MTKSGKHIVTKGEIARFAAEASESIYMRERVKIMLNPGS